MPSHKQLTETLARSTALRTSAYGDARLLNGAEHRGCWVRLKAHPRRIPPSLPPFSGESWEGGLFPSPGKELPSAPGEQTPFRPPSGVQGDSPRRGYSVSPCSQKRWRVGRWDNGVRHHKPPLLPLSPSQLLLAKEEQLCYSAPMKSAAGPLLLLGACRIHEHCGLTIENGRGAEGTPQGARPSEEGLGPERPPL